MDELGYSEADIQAHTTPKSFERGLQYYQSGAVRRIVRRGDRVLTRVDGTDYRPYRIQVILGEHGIEEARCTCPYDWGGWCKHIVAVLLAMLERPERIVERATIESLVDELDPNQLRDLILHLTDRYPRLITKIEQWLALDKP